MYVQTVLYFYQLLLRSVLQDPLVLGATNINPSSSTPPVQNDEFVTTMENLGSKTFQSRYAWIPAVFSVSDDGKDVHIGSYINGLGPRDRYPSLYRVIEKVFLLALPHFEKTLAFEFENEKTASGTFNLRDKDSSSLTRICRTTVAR